MADTVLVEYLGGQRSLRVLMRMCLVVSFKRFVIFNERGRTFNHLATSTSTKSKQKQEKNKTAEPAETYEIEQISCVEIIH